MWRLRNGGEAGFPVAKSQRLTVVKLIWAERPRVPEQQRRGADDHRKYHRVQGRQPQPDKSAPEKNEPNAVEPNTKKSLNASTLFRSRGP